MVRKIDTTIRQDEANKRHLESVLREIGAHALLPLKRQTDGMGILVKYKGISRPYTTIELMSAALRVRLLQRNAVAAMRIYHAQGKADPDEMEALAGEVESSKAGAADFLCDILESKKAE